VAAVCMTPAAAAQRLLGYLGITPDG